MTHLTKAHRSFDGELAYTFHAKVILEKMKGDPDWPSWIGPSSVDYEPDVRER